MSGTNHSTSGKLCPRCGREKPVSQFYRDRSRSDGFDTYCKVCRNRYTSSFRRRKRLDNVIDLVKRYAAAQQRERRRKNSRTRYKERKECAVEGCKRLGVRHHVKFDPPAIIWLCEEHHDDFHVMQNQLDAWCALLNLP